jgi:monoamine oxidase
MPPAVVSAMKFDPPLPVEQARAQRGTATWCGDWCKVVACFDGPLWREQGASGVITSEAGPISVWWEGAGGMQLGEGTSALIGLGFGREACAAVGRLLGDGRCDGSGGACVGREESPLRAFVVSQLGAVLGAPQVEAGLLRCRAKIWMDDPLTFAEGATGRAYGHPLLRQPTSWGVHFAGTETEDDHGHVEGALAAGQRAAREVLAALGGAE